jgi:tripartite-type tricarboxylate transporter receptor subunit TctC
VRYLGLAVGALALGLFSAVAAQAQDPKKWPEKTVHIVVPLTAGSATDMMARLVARKLTEQLGQQFVVENKPGAGGTIGTGAVARAKPDGYTLLVQSASYTVTPTTYPNTPYDTQRDLMGVTPLGLLPQALVVSPTRGIDSVKSLIETARAKPGTLNYGSAGVGTANQLNAERFRIGAGIDTVHIPFKGTPEVVNEVLAGRIDYFFCPVNVCVPMIREKRLVALGMGSGKRSAALPDLPTTVELGVPNSDYNFWVGLFLPAATPPEIVQKLYAETAKAIESPEIKAGLNQLGAEASLIEPETYNRQLKQEIVDNAALVKAAGIPIAQ